MILKFWNLKAVAASKGGMGAFAPPVRGSAPHTFPPVRRKNGQNKLFLANFWIFAPSESHFTPSMPPTKKFLVPPLVEGVDQSHDSPLF